MSKQYLWRVVEERTHNIAADLDGTPIANVFSEDHLQLVAAAPDLLAACEEMVSLWERVHEQNGPVLLGRLTLNQARAAINYAKGKS